MSDTIFVYIFSESILLFAFSDNIRALIGYLKDEQLANFCRILAVAISDLDIYDNKSSCKYNIYDNTSSCKYNKI